ncbi:Hypothetical protein CINCED_3A015718 [Cinara cedri]|uniref:Uncharacterized protein n=1 Tax=Cinara cedri TaxID=506608 RepID=A0A5E4M9Z8_9HEMI|nr:Hypothetical protein CINCED_3A015718 [Cinara cedri]
MKLLYYCSVIFSFLFIANIKTSQNDDEHVDLSLSKQKKKSNQPVNSTTHPTRTIHHEDLECIDSDKKPCSSLPYPCITCHMNDSCVYGNQTIAVCKANVECVGNNTFAKNLTCRYCYQIEFWEYKCIKKICNSAASPPIHYRTNCTVNRDVLCLGKRKFYKRLRCNWTGGHRWSTALILSITLGGFGIDRTLARRYRQTLQFWRSRSLDTY